MELRVDPQAAYKVQPGQTETYVAFRTAIPKPPHEDAHLRHIFRFYISRAMQKRGEQDIYVLPSLMVGDQHIQVDVLASSPGKYTVAICEPASVTPETETLLEVLKDADHTETIVVHSQYGNPGNVMEKFKEELEAGKFRLLAVVPPPFDDAYEYDIWMFETTFRDLFARE
ncbi:MAG: hypothetical protein H5T64_13355 [Chloroflexi bacterium]|nr:hypothetical protein [Chloroflexota bacterium]